MAKPIQTVERLPVNPIQEKQQNKEELIDLLIENKEGIVSLIEIVQKLQESGLLDMVNALLGRGDKVLSILLAEVNKPKLSNILDRLVNLAEMVGEIETEKLKSLTTQINAGIIEAESHLNGNKETTLIDLLKTLKDPEINRTITVFLGFLKGAGKLNNMD